jgi:hypothetical protein
MVRREEGRGQGVERGARLTRQRRNRAETAADLRSSDELFLRSGAI